MEGGPDSLCAAVTRLAEPPDVQLSCILNGAPMPLCDDRGGGHVVSPPHSRASSHSTGGF